MNFRPARPEDLPCLVDMLADDPIGQTREDPSNLEPYRKALASIGRDPNQLLLVCEQSQLLGFLQLTFIPGLTYQGGWRAQIEGVRVQSRCRSRGVGRLLLEEAVRLARQRGCVLVQLTTDLARPGALRFYQRLGFTASHSGLKLALQ
ncbi:MAG: GNAT family N-acetyltransferase [Vulcanimicrobiota bacterium]